MNCTACGKELNSGARFCSHCGQAAYPQTYTPPNPPPAQPFAPYPSQPLYRPLYGRMLGGVCASLAQHFGWDVVLVRMVLCVLVCLGSVALLLAYLIAWIVIPNQPFAVPSQPYAPPYTPPPASPPV